MSDPTTSLNLRAGPVADALARTERRENGLRANMDEIATLAHQMVSIVRRGALRPDPKTGWLESSPSPAASPASPSGPSYVVNCCNCGRIVDTREKDEGGDGFGAELSDGRWTCSPECWDAVVDPEAIASDATPAPVDEQVFCCDEVIDDRASDQQVADLKADLAEAEARVAQAVEASKAMEKLLSECAAEFTVDGKWSDTGQLVKKRTFYHARTAAAAIRGEK